MVKKIWRSFTVVSLVKSSGVAFFTTALNTIRCTPTSVMGDLGLTLRAAAISWSWLTNSVMDRRSSGFTFNMEPGQQEEEEEVQWERREKGNIKNLRRWLIIRRMTKTWRLIKEEIHVPDKSNNIY